MDLLQEYLDCFYLVIWWKASKSAANGIGPIGASFLRFVQDTLNKKWIAYRITQNDFLTSADGKDYLKAELTGHEDFRNMSYIVFDLVLWLTK